MVYGVWYVVCRVYEAVCLTPVVHIIISMYMHNRVIAYAHVCIRDPCICGTSMIYMHACMCACVHDEHVHKMHVYIDAMHAHIYTMH